MRLRFWLSLLAIGSCFALSSRGAESPAINAPKRPLAPSTAAPVPTGPPVKLRVSNYTGRGLEAVWMKPHAAPQNSGLIPPTTPGGSPAQLDTRGGHLWLFKSEGRVVQVFAASDRPVQELRIGPAPVALGPRTEMRGLVLQDPIPVPVPILPPATPKPLAIVKGAPAAAQEFLRVHNEERVRVGVKPLRWSKKLARLAQKWAERLASSGDFKHRKPTVDDYGECLYRSGGTPSAADAARRWLEERPLYPGGPIPLKERRTVGHYTQMIWDKTKVVGYGMAHGPRGVVVVANYYPAGNRYGRTPYKQ